MNRNTREIWRLEGEVERLEAELAVWRAKFSTPEIVETRLAELEQSMRRAAADIADAAHGITALTEDRDRWHKLADERSARLAELEGDRIRELAIASHKSTVAYGAAQHPAPDLGRAFNEAHIALYEEIERVLAAEAAR
jgi:chromosome segregation ATPase